MSDEPTTTAVPVTTWDWSSTPPIILELVAGQLILQQLGFSRDNITVALTPDGKGIGVHLEQTERRFFMLLGEAKSLETWISSLWPMVAQAVNDGVGDLEVLRARIGQTQIYQRIPLLIMALVKFGFRPQEISTQLN